MTAADLPRSPRRPLSVDMHQVQGELEQWLTQDLQRRQEARETAIAPASIAGKASFTNLADRIAAKLLKLKPADLADAEFQNQLTRINEWLAEGIKPYGHYLRDGDDYA